MGCQVGKKCTHPIYTHISWWVYRTLKTDQSFSTPRSLHLSSPLSTLSFLIRQSGCMCRKGRGLALCLCERVHLCVPSACAAARACACARRVGRRAALGAFHVHYHLFYSGIFKSGGLGMAAAIVREQRRALRVSGGCGMPSAELFSKCCTPHFMESQGGWPGQPCRQTELNSTHSCINGSLCAIPPH